VRLFAQHAASDAVECSPDASALLVMTRSLAVRRLGPATLLAVGRMLLMSDSIEGCMFLRCAHCVHRGHGVNHGRLAGQA
jgi:hypothetical protein